MNQTRDHYSYRVYADSSIARNFDADRFGGTIGEQIKLTQERIVFATLPDVKGWKVIDVGAGTGRFTIPFLESGAGQVSACDASKQMLDVLQEKVRDPRLSVHVVDAHELNFPDRQFDCALSFRMLLHVIDWKKALSELCRVSGDWVVFDIPPRHGFLLLAPVFHSLRSLFSKNVQKYRTFRLREVYAELDRNGFEAVTVDPGFFLPLIVYRTLRSRTLMRAAERVFGALRFTRVAGSPFTIFARRKK
jgi:ubiquinone/menaquinone biosynthesis C-methylase UbiE